MAGSIRLHGFLISRYLRLEVAGNFGGLYGDTRAGKTSICGAYMAEYPPCPNCADSRPVFGMFGFFG
jgi:hypothetical protein